MTPAELAARLQALGAGALKGRAVFAVAAGVALGPLPRELLQITIDAEELLLGRDWPPGNERRRAVARALGERLATIVAGAAGRPLLVVVERADALAGELDSLAPAFESFAGDDRMLIFRCADATPVPALEQLPPQLQYRPGKALRRFADFSLPTVSTDREPATAAGSALSHEA